MITPNILFPNWRGRTCGECAWRLLKTTDTRGRKCDTDDLEPACPAFVAREEEVDHDR